MKYNPSLSPIQQQQLWFLGPVMRPSQKTKEERLWVLDTINKYFDVIVEEEDEEEKEDVDDEDDSIGVLLLFKT